MVVPASAVTKPTVSCLSLFVNTAGRSRLRPRLFRGTIDWFQYCHCRRTTALDAGAIEILLPLERCWTCDSTAFVQAAGGFARGWYELQRASHLVGLRARHTYGAADQAADASADRDVAHTRYVHGARRIFGGTGIRIGYEFGLQSVRCAFQCAIE